MVDVNVAAIELTVLDDPREIRLDTNIGAAGDRGSYSNYGSLEVADLVLENLAGGTPQYFDTYTVVNPASDNYLQVYQYVTISGVDQWSPVVKLKQDTYSKNVLTTFTSGVSEEIKINTADIGYTDLAAGESDFAGSRFWYNVQVTLRDDTGGENLFYPTALTVKVEDVETNLDDENELPITIYAAEFDGTSWSNINGKALIAQITVNAAKNSSSIIDELGGS